MSLASDLQALERELGKVAAYQGNAILHRILDVSVAVRGLIAVTPPEVLAAIKPAGMAAGLFIGKKMALGFTIGSAIEKLIAEVKTNAPSLASFVAELHGVVASDTKRAA